MQVMPPGGQICNQILVAKLATNSSRDTEINFELFWLKNLLMFWDIGPCESSRPDDSENVVLFERATFLTGVIAAQSRNMSAKLKASRKLGGVKKKVTATIFGFWT